jgi:NitT/TauT family transport system substrate-binding protein
MAKVKGFFEREGISRPVDLVWGAVNADPLGRVASGEIDFCTGWLSEAVHRREQGEPIVLLAQVMDRSSFMLVTRADSGIVRPQDMTGRLVGLWGGNFSIQPNAFFSQYGIEPVTVQQTSSIFPFLRGAVDVASVMYYNEYHKLMEAGLRKEDLHTFLFADHGLNIPEDGVYMTDAFRDAHPRDCEAIVEAVRQGWAYALAHQEETLDLVLRYCEQEKFITNRNHQKWMLNAFAESVHPDRDNWGLLTESEYDSAIKVLSAQGIIEAPPPYGSFHRPAARRGGAR